MCTPLIRAAETAPCPFIAENRNSRITHSCWQFSLQSRTTEVIELNRGCGRFHSTQPEKSRSLDECRMADRRSSDIAPKSVTAALLSEFGLQGLPAICLGA